MKNQSKINGIIRTIILSFGIIALSFNVGCKKKTDDVVTPVAQTCKVSKLVIQNSLSGKNSTIDITYNSDNKIISAINTTTGEPTQTTTYTYLPNGRIKEVNSNTPNNYIEYEFNTSGNVKTKYQSENGSITTTQYQYDTEGYLIQSTSEFDILTYTYENGNIKRIVWTNPSNTYTSTTEYEYTGALVASNGNQIFTNDWFMPAGKKNKNLYTKTTSTISWGPDVRVTDVSYILDSNNKITKATFQYASGTPSIYDFSYTCQ